MPVEITSVDDKSYAQFVLGCDPQVHIKVIAFHGQLNVSITSLDLSGESGDLDALFFNLTDPDLVGQVGMWSPAASSAVLTDDGVNSLSDGTQLLSDYDARIEFSPTDSGIDGHTQTAQFTIWSGARPLTIEDLDFESFAAVVDSDDKTGAVLTLSDDDPQQAITEYGWELSALENGWDYTPPEEAASDKAGAEFVIEGDVNVRVSLTELDDGDMKVDVSVLDDTGSIGDLRGLFFNLTDDSLVRGLSVSGDDVTASEFDANDVNDLGRGNNINGDVRNEVGEFDGGIGFGRSGIGGGGDIRETSFVLSHASEALTLEDFAGQHFAVRLTSVGSEDGPRNDSLKLLGKAEFAEACCDDQYMLSDLDDLFKEPEPEEVAEVEEDLEPFDILV